MNKFPLYIPVYVVTGLEQASFYGIGIIDFL